MISADFYPTLQTYADGEIERTDVINNLYDNTVVGSPYYLGYIEHDDFPKSFGVSLVDYARGMTFNNIESNHSWGYCFNKNVYNTTGTSPNLAVIQDANGHAGIDGDRYCFLNKIKMAQQNFDNTVTFTMHFMYVPTADIDDSGTTYFNQGYGFASASVTATIEQIKNMVDGSADVYASWTRNNITYPALKYADFNEYGLALVQSNDGTMTAAICISQVNIGDSGRYSYGTSTNVRCSVLPFFEHDYDDKHILAAQGTGYVDDPTIAWYQSLGIIRPHTNFGMTYDNQLYMFAPYPYDILTDDLPTYNLYQRSGLVKGQYFLQYYAVYSGYVAMYAYAHYDLKDIYTMMLYYHKIYTGTSVFSKSYSTDISVATFNDHDGATGDRLSDDYANIADQLRDWQQPDTDIAVNEYDPADKPEYDPSGDDEDEESGTRIPNQFRYFTGANNFISQYAMKASQIQTFGQMLWNSWADSQTFVDAVNNFWIALNIEEFTGSFDISSVMNFIVSLKVFPFNITHFETSIFTLTDTLRIGRGTFPFLFPSEVGNIIKVLSNIVYVDCGLIHDPTTGQYGIPRKFNDFRDYTNVSITCFCPYCGTVELNPGDVVGRQLSCKYAVDLQSGECLCLITVADSTGDLYNVAAISGNMGAEIPVSATNSGLIQSRRLSDAGNALGLFGGMFTENMSMGSNTFARAKDSQSSIGAIASATSQAAGNLFKDIKQTSNFAANMLSRGAIGCPIMQGGSGFAAFSQADTPYVQIRYGIYSEPANYSHSVGRISTKSDTLSNYKDSGLVICENVDVSGFTCHEDERSEIKALLESGVYL